MAGACARDHSEWGCTRVFRSWKEMAGAEQASTKFRRKCLLLSAARHQLSSTSAAPPPVVRHRSSTPAPLPSNLCRFYSIFPSLPIRSVPPRWATQWRRRRADLLSRASTPSRQSKSYAHPSPRVAEKSSPDLADSQGIIGLICFLCPGMLNALSGIGGGGQVDASASNNGAVALVSFDIVYFPRFSYSRDQY